MKIGLLFGSFNPVHLGHLLLATHIREYAKLDEVWLVVSPHNPHKTIEALADDHHRLKMVELALANHPFLKTCNIEFNLSKPSFTHQTLKILTGEFPATKFSVVIGQDNMEKFDTWKEVEWIKNNFEILIYTRSNYHSSQSLGTIIHLPLIDISATEIRQRIKQEKSIRYFVPENVERYISEQGLYK